MLILLPPSEGKHRPTSGPPLQIDDRAPALRAPTRDVAHALRELCLGEPAVALQTLGLKASQADLLEDNAELLDSPAAPAHEIYTGVLYQALDYASLSAAARQRADLSIWVASALYGVVRLGEPIASYRLSGGTRLPGLSPPAQLWQDPITEVMAAADPAIVLDLRSGAYASLWQPPPSWADRVVVGKVWQAGPAGQRTAVSHHNKATKGLLARELIRARRPVTSIRSLVTTAKRAGQTHGWTAELAAGQLDIVLAPK